MQQQGGEHVENTTVQGVPDSRKTAEVMRRTEPGVVYSEKRPVERNPRARSRSSRKKCVTSRSRQPPGKWGKRKRGNGLGVVVTPAGDQAESQTFSCTRAQKTRIGCGPPDSFPRCYLHAVPYTSTHEQTPCVPCYLPRSSLISLTLILRSRTPSMARIVPRQTRQTLVHYRP